MNSAGFRDRADAGRQLADRLGRYGHRSDVSVLALPRGGVPVAHEVATALAITMNVLLVRKLGVPGQEELAMGAVALIAGHESVVRNESIIAKLDLDTSIFDHAVLKQRQELAHQERLFRGEDVQPERLIQDHIVILVDDGLATGATMRVAIEAVRPMHPAKVIVAVPVAPKETVARLTETCDEVICLLSPDDFGGVGQWYEDFAQVSDEQVQALLQQHRNRQYHRSSQSE